MQEDGRKRDERESQPRTSVAKSGVTHRFLELDGFFIRSEGKELLSLEFQPLRGNIVGFVEPIDDGFLFFSAQL